MELQITGMAPVPAYYRLQELLKKNIEDSTWKPGEGIPSERILSMDHGVSIGTVKKAIMNLVNAGYLYRVQGKGTFVGGTTLKRGSLRYYRMMRDFGDNEDDLSIVFHGLSTVRGNEKAEINLDMPPGRSLYEIRRLFLSGNKPVIWSVSFLPKSLFKNLDSIPPTAFEHDTLYETIENRYNLPCLYNRELFGAVKAPPDIAALLNVPSGTSLLSIEMISYTYKSKPYEYRLSYCITGQRRVFRTIE